MQLGHQAGASRFARKRSPGRAQPNLAQALSIVVLRIDASRGSILPLQLHVFSTRSYELRFRSRNGGKLRLDNSQWSIPYSLIVGDKPADIVSGASLTPSPATAVRQDALPLAFDVGSVENTRAGTYSDLITISVAVR